MRTLIQGRLARRLPQITDEVRRGNPLRITEYGEPILHHPCRPVTEFGADKWATLIDDMFATMWIAEGVGLAANQVGVDIQLFVYDLTDEDGTRHLGHVFNPRVEASSGLFGDQSGSEGCLSVPGAYALLPRPARATVHGFDLDGEPITIEGTDYFARCLVHETQHLHGLLYVDHLAPDDRERALDASAARRTEVFERRSARTRELGK